MLLKGVELLQSIMIDHSALLFSQAKLQNVFWFDSYCTQLVIDSLVLFKLQFSRFLYVKYWKVEQSSQKKVNFLDIKSANY